MLAFAPVSARVVAMDWLRHGAILSAGAILIVSSVFETAFAASEPCPGLPAVSGFTIGDEARRASWQNVAAPYSVVQWFGGYDYAPLGIGHLRVEQASDHYYDWPRSIVLPFWLSPDGALGGWIRAGHVYPASDQVPWPLTGAGMVETDYEHQTLIVFEIKKGWLRIKLKPGEGGDVWVHRCHLSHGTAHLVFQSWPDFIEEHGSWLHFRASVPHALRQGPSVSAARVTWIGTDHELTLLEMKGDWMRVRVRQPAWTCVGPGQEFTGREDEGWIKWRDELTGPWVWIYSRGC